jgi:hypothetical protein
VIFTRNADVKVLKQGGYLSSVRFTKGSQFIVVGDEQVDADEIELTPGVSAEDDVEESPLESCDDQLRDKERFLKLRSLVSSPDATSLVRASFDDLVKKAGIKLAWALTVHKFLGTI